MGWVKANWVQNWKPNQWVLVGLNSNLIIQFMDMGWVRKIHPNPWPWVWIGFPVGWVGFQKFMNELWVGFKNSWMDYGWVSEIHGWVMGGLPKFFGGLTQLTGELRVEYGFLEVGYGLSFKSQWVNPTQIQFPFIWWVFNLCAIQNYG